jgi:hypothetical protein
MVLGAITPTQSQIPQVRQVAAPAAPVQAPANYVPDPGQNNQNGETVIRKYLPYLIAGAFLLIFLNKKQ